MRIYKNVNGTWEKVGDDIDGVKEWDGLGNSVSLSADGSIVAIGATEGDVNGSNSGLVSVYRNLNNKWKKIGEDITGENVSDYLGFSVSLSADGSVIAIGAYPDWDNDLGYVRIYKNVNESWEKVGNDIDGVNKWDFKESGWSVSLSNDGSIVAIGAPGSSLVRIYQNVNENWEQVGEDIFGEAIINGDSKSLEGGIEKAGFSVSLSDDGSIVAIGDIENDGKGEDIFSNTGGQTAGDSGHVRVYQNLNGTWTQLGSDIDGKLDGDWLGYSVSLSADGTMVAIGAPTRGFYGTDNIADSGYVSVYQIDLDKTAPSILGPSGDAGDSTSSKLFNENSSAIHTFSANETVSWSITGGVDKDKFIINSSTGDLSFRSAPDYELSLIHI